jgi:hypothetical protein
MKSFVLNRTYDTESFVGHCCLIKAQRKVVRSEEVSYSSSRTSIGGDLYLYEYNLLIDSPPNGDVDVHALGAESTLNALWHCVVTDDRAKSLSTSPMSSRNFDQFTTEVEIALPYAPKIKKKVCNSFVSISIFYSIVTF